MKNKIVRTYTAPTEENYYEILRTIVECSYRVDIISDRKNLKIALAFNDDDPALQEEMAEVAKELNLTVSDDNAVFMFTEDREIAKIEERIRDEISDEIRSLRKEREDVARDKDFYCNRFKKSQENFSRIKTQIKSISVLLSTLLTE